MKQLRALCLPLMILLFAGFGCGVKGKPLPPENPVFIGHGQGEDPSQVTPLPEPRPAAAPRQEAPKQTDPGTVNSTQKKPAKKKIKQ